MESGSEAESVAHYRQQIYSVVANKPWIVATGILVASVRLAKELKSLGANKVLAIGATRGTGSIDIEDDDIETLDLQMQPIADMMDAIRTEEALLANLPTWVCNKIAAFDPNQQAKVVGNIFSGNSLIGGRPSFGFRPKSWQNLENKMIIDDLWGNTTKRRPS